MMRWLKTADRFVRDLGLAQRMMLVSVVLLLLLQAASYGVLSGSIEGNARAQIARELEAGESIWRRELNRNAEQLRQAARLLAADYGFRDAVNSGDSDTIGSVLDNHGERIGATVTGFLAPDFTLKSTGENSKNLPLEAAMLAMASRLSKDSSGDGMALLGGVPYQFVLVPMRAPALVGWVLMGFPLPAAMASDVQRLLGVYVNVLAVAGPEATPVISLSTLPPHDHPGVLKLGPEVMEFDASVGHLVVRRVHTESRVGSITTLLMRSVDEVVAPYRTLQEVLGLITVVALALFALASGMTAWRMVAPLRALTDAAGDLERGQFDRPLDAHLIRPLNEIGRLAKAFEHMRTSVAAQQAEIRMLAYSDRLTGLPNRVRFREQVRTHIDENLSTATPLSVIILDLDRFKHVNDVMGFAFGDRLLKAVAERLTLQVTRTHDVVARLAGNEFAVLLPQSDLAGAMVVARRIEKSFEVAMAFEDQTIDLSAGMGLASWPAHASDADLLLSRAEIAMYTAKMRTSGIQVYDPSLDSASTQTLSLLTELRQAIDGGQLRLYLQPKIGLLHHTVVAAEALVRWEHPQRGLVPPMQFIPFAEQTGFVRQLTLWMFEEAARTWQSLQVEGEHLRVAINLSTRDLLDVDFPMRLAVLLEKYGVEPGCFCLEITESAIMDDPQRAENTLNRLASQGFKLSIDDFGTGYSSLAYLKRLPVNELKIDKSFVMGMAKDDSDIKIVRSTIDLAHNLGLTVVAEGVEDQAIYERLRDMGCDEGQGYHMSRPIPAIQLPQWRSQWKARQEAAALAAGGA